MEKKRRVIWERLENEYGVPIKDILQYFLFNSYAPLTYKDTAAVLGVSRRTLRIWRKDLDIEKRPKRVRYSWIEKPVDKQARVKGYADIVDAIRDLKLNKNMGVKGMANFLGVSVTSILHYTPDELKQNYEKF